MRNKEKAARAGFADDIDETALNPDRPHHIGGRRGWPRNALARGRVRRAAVSA
jgi:hypothetical protein